MLWSITLRSSIIQNQLSEIGEIKPMIREINLNAAVNALGLVELGAVDPQVCNESIFRYH
jgi:hypothetical protein